MPVPGNEEGMRGKRHATKFRQCALGVTYEVPLSCSRVYVGQTGRCINDRIGKHSAGTRQSPSDHFAVHGDRCECQAEFNGTKIMKKFKTKLEHENMRHS